MKSSIARRDNYQRNHRDLRLRPVAESIETRLLPSGATISGTVLNDVTGNGFSADDTSLAGVVVDLRLIGSTQVLQKARTDAFGSFRFTGLAAGTYFVQQEVPAGFLATGGLAGYTFSVMSGQSVGSAFFDDFRLYPPPAFGFLAFVVTPPGGQPKLVLSLSGNVHAGDQVSAVFNLARPERLTLVSYIAPNGTFDINNLRQQILFSQSSSSSTATGMQVITVTVPNSHFQLDFVAGPAIDHLETNPNVAYHPQSRFLDGDKA